MDDKELMLTPEEQMTALNERHIRLYGEKAHRREVDSERDRLLLQAQVTKVLTKLSVIPDDLKERVADFEATTKEHLRRLFIDGDSQYHLEKITEKFRLILSEITPYYEAQRLQSYADGFKQGAFEQERKDEAQIAQARTEAFKEVGEWLKDKAELKKISAGVAGFEPSYNHYECIHVLIWEEAIDRLQGGEKPEEE